MSRRAAPKRLIEKLDPEDAFEQRLNKMLAEVFALGQFMHDQRALSASEFVKWVDDVGRCGARVYNAAGEVKRFVREHGGFSTAEDTAQLMASVSSGGEPHNRVR